ncbi:MAG: N-acetyltransferase [Thermodesulfobacteriales bacterium]|nr:MAG: N-acetyltransferase [Thermodesulfobacteriales bacterium]
MSGYFRLKIDVESELELISQSRADELFDLIEDNREYLKEWLPWLDNNRYFQNTIDFIKISQIQYERNETVQFALMYKGKVAGVVGYHRIDWLNRSTSIGYWLGEQYQGKGLIAKSCSKVLDYSFGRMGLNRIEIRCATENLKSRAIPKRLGFKEEGLIREAEWLYDHFVDHVVYGMLESEWLNNDRLVINP